MRKINYYRIGIIAVICVLFGFLVFNAIQLKECNTALNNQVGSLKKELVKEENTNKKDKKENTDTNFKSQTNNTVTALSSDVNKNDDINEDLQKGQKVAYLTIDDGPSANTHRILNVLKENGIHATFFVVGKQAEMYPGYIKDEYDAGNMVLTHCYNHDYSIYKSFDTYYNDLNKALNIIDNQVGLEIPHIVRFPGGVNNTTSYAYGGRHFMYNLTSDMMSKGYHYVDWNVSSGDGSAKLQSSDVLLNNILNGAKGKKVITILCHDSNAKGTTVDMLPVMIRTLKDRGYVFNTFKNISDANISVLQKYDIMDRKLKQPR